MRKITVWSIFLILFSASSCCPPCNQWKVAVIKGDCPPSKYTKAYLPACNAFNGMEAVVMYSNCDTQMFLYALTLLFPIYGDDCEHTEINVCLDDEDYAYIVDRLEGGQCLRLPGEARDLIICALLDGKSLDITAGRYQTTLIPDNFSKVYGKLPVLETP